MEGMKPRVLLALALLLAAPGGLAHEAPQRRVDELDRFLAVSPDDAALLLDRASALRHLERWGEALADLTRSLALAPGLREARLELALTRLESGDAPGALADLDLYLGSGEPARAALAARGKILEDQGLLSLARDDYQAALAISVDPELILARGRVEETLGDLDSAARGYEQGLRELAGAAVVRVALVNVEIARKGYPRALALIADETGRSRHGRGEWLLLRARVHQAQGKTALAQRDRLAALDEARLALESRPSDLKKLAVARALAALGRAAEARPLLREILASSPALDDAQKLLSQLDATPQGPRR